MDEVKKIAECAKALMLKFGSYEPIVLVKGTKDKVVVGLNSLGETNEERVRKLHNVGTWTACKHNVGELELIVLVNEAWMSSNLTVLPSQDPKHVKMLLINSLDARTQEEQITGFEVIRDPKGQVIDLKDWDHPENGSVKGTLLPAFQRGYQLVSPVLN